MVNQHWVVSKDCTSIELRSGVDAWVVITKRRGSAHRCWCPQCNSADIPVDSLPWLTRLERTV